MPARTPQTDASRGLALAMLSASTAPLVLLDGALKIVGLSASFAERFQIEPVGATGRSFSTLGHGEWRAPQLRALLELTLSGATEIDAYEMDLRREGQDPRSLVLNARRVEYPTGAKPLLLLTIADVTDARLSEKLKDELVR